MKKWAGFVCATLLCSAVSFGSVTGETRNEASDDFSIADDTNTVAWAGTTPVIVLPPGETQWSAVLAPPFRSDRMRMSYYKTVHCPVSPYVEAFVRNAETNVWYRTNVSHGYDTFPAMLVDQVWFKFQQMSYGTMGCRFKLEFRNAGQVTTPEPPVSQEGEVLAGAISFQGGYAPGLSLSIPPQTAIKSFRIANPSFCSADVLEAGTVTEGIYAPAKLIEKSARVYSVNNGAGSRVTEIRVSLNGPENTPCSLPVYVRTVQE